MKIQLIAYTSPNVFARGLPALSTVQEFVGFCARVSNPSNQFNNETADKLIDYLIKHKHWSPLEMANAVIEVNTTRDIARQLLRHRSFSFQEFSQRYADPTKGFDFVTRECRFQDPKNRQSSIEATQEDANTAKEWEQKQLDIISAITQTYNWAIEKGIAKEQARAVLPEGLTPSKLYVNGTLRSWAHYIELRTKKETQKEHRLMARECAKAIASIFPRITNFVEAD